MMTRRFRTPIVVSIFVILALYHFTSLKENTTFSVEKFKHAGHEAAPQKPIVTTPAAKPPVAPFPAPPAPKPTPPKEEPAPAPPKEVAKLPPPAETTKPPAPAPADETKDTKEDTKPAPEQAPSVPDRESSRPGGMSPVAEIPIVQQDESERWERKPVHYPLAKDKIIKLPTGEPAKIPRIQAAFKETAEAKKEREGRQQAVKTAFVKSWTAYKEQAWGHDEVIPVTGGFRDPFGGWGATLVDALDTLWIMGLKEDFELAVETVAKIDFWRTPNDDIPLFETTIRYLGGLLAAYDVSDGKYPVLLEKAKQLGDMLYGAFDTPNRMPQLFYVWKPKRRSYPAKAPRHAIMAELGSLSMEFTRLAQLTRNDTYYDAIARIGNALEDYQNRTTLPGLWPLRADSSLCQEDLTDSTDSADDATTKLSGTGVGTGPGASDSDKVSDAKAKAEPKPAVVMKPSPKLDEESHSGGLVHTQSEERSEVDDLESDSAVGKQLSKRWTEEGTPEKPCTARLGRPFDVRMEEYSLGALIDSLYEYLVKEYLLLGGVPEAKQYQKMFEKAMDVVKEKLLFRPEVLGDPDILLSGHLASGIVEKLSPSSSHLACFAGGMFALGSKAFKRTGDMKIASRLTQGCVWAYGVTRSGIMPESFTVNKCNDTEACDYSKDRWVESLRPDPEFMAAVESSRRARESIEAAAAKESEAAAKAAAAGAVAAGAPGSGGSSASDPELAKDSAPLKEPKAFGRVSTESGDVREEEVAKDSTPTRVQKREPPPAPGAGTENEPVTADDFARQTIEREGLPPGFRKLNDRRYIMRPEAIESVWYMYRVTGDTKWQDRGWRMFEAVDENTRSDLAHSGILDIMAKKGDQRFGYTDSLESFWFGETLKYFYLLFSEPDVISLDDWVLNTEAHPFKRPKPKGA